MLAANNYRTTYEGSELEHKVTLLQPMIHTVVDTLDGAVQAYLDYGQLKMTVGNVLDSLFCELQQLKLASALQTSGKQSVSMRDLNRKYNELLEEMKALEAAEENAELFVPETYDLLPAYPNPFNASVRVSFDLPHAGFVSLKVFNVMGREVTELAGKDYAAGRHTQVFRAEGLASGVYFVHMAADRYHATQKILLIK